VQVDKTAHEFLSAALQNQPDSMPEGITWRNHGSPRDMVTQVHHSQRYCKDNPTRDPKAALYRESVYLAASKCGKSCMLGLGIVQPCSLT
jgi:hypothetical protein